MHIKGKIFRIGLMVGLFPMASHTAVLGYSKHGIDFFYTAKYNYNLKQSL